MVLQNEIAYVLKILDIFRLASPFLRKIGLICTVKNALAAAIYRVLQKPKLYNFGNRAIPYFTIPI